MYKRFAIVLGGAKSGKSSFALELGSSIAEEGALEKVFVATARTLDKEMEERVRLHREERGQGWRTIEEPINVAEALKGLEARSVAIVDCLTLWLSNLMEITTDDASIMETVGKLADTASESRASVIMVSNEVGGGIVPSNPLSRRFRDLAGRTNQSIAAIADEAYYIVAGMPIKMR